MSSNVITELTPEQEAKIPEYRQRFLEIGLSTTPTDRAKAEAAMIRSYEYLHKDNPSLCVPNPKIIWAESPRLGQIEAAKYANNTQNPTTEQIRDQADKASYGSFEAYWVSTYSFIANELPVPKNELHEIVTEVIKECGVYWSFYDLAIITPKPSKIHIQNEKLSCTTGPALLYPNGDGIYAFEGERKGSLMEVVMAARNAEAEKSVNVE